MGVRFVIGRAGSGKTEYCLRAAREALEADLWRGPRLILLVPDQAAAQMERALLTHSRLRTLGRCDVLSFRRLAHRVLNEAAAWDREAPNQSGGGAPPAAAHTPGPLPVTLTPTGRGMVLRYLARRHRAALREFASVVDRAGFIAGLSDAVVELIQESVAPDRLAAASAGLDPLSAERLHDVALLYERYLAYLGSERVDPEGVLELACARLDAAPWLRGARLWVDGFAGFTAQQVHLLAALAARAAETHLTLLVDPRESFVASDAWAPDDLSLFGRTERTAREQLVPAFRAAGLVIDPPLILGLDPPPRFTDAPALAGLERGLFATPPATPDAAPAPATPLPAEARGPFRIVEAPDRRAEAAAVAREIVRLTRHAERPLRYRDIAVIARDLEPYHDLLSAALREHDVPFFIDRRRPTAHHPLVECVRALLALRSGHPQSGEAIPLLLKTGLTPLKDNHADALENYQRAFGLYSPQSWSGAWRFDRSDDPSSRRRNDAALANLSRLNEARRTLLTALGDWWAPTPTADERADAAPPPCRRTAEALFFVLQRLGVPRRLSAWVRAARDADEAREHEQVWGAFAALLDEVVGALGDEPMPSDEFVSVLEAGLADFTLGLVPPTLDQVLVGAIERSRHPPLRAVFVIGFADGAWPPPHAAEELIGDDERDLLRRGGVALRPPRRARMLDERLFAYIALTRASERLWISYPSTDEQGRPMLPSPYLDHVRASLGRAAPPHEVLAPIGHRMYSDEVATTEQMLTALGAGLREFAGAADISPSAAVVPGGMEDWPALYERARREEALRPPLRRALAALCPIRPPWPTLSPNAAAALCRNLRRVSVTQLESFASCPFQHYAAFHLRLHEREEHGLGSPELGLLYHRMLEQFVRELIEKRERLSDLSDADVRRRLAGIAAQAAELAAEWGLDEAQQAALLRDTNRELPPAVAAQRIADESGLHPHAVEATFGGGAEDDLPALRIDAGDGRTVDVHGRIDRIDLLDAGGEKRAVVFDYKRSRSDRKPDWSRVVHGLSLQLTAYLLVLKDHGDRLAPGAAVRPAGAFFAPLLDGFTPLAHPGQAPRARRYRPRGIIDRDGYRAINPQGDANEYGPWLYETDTLERPDFDAMLERVRERMGELAGELVSGTIQVAPARIAGGPLPCAHCPYRAVCRFEHISGLARSLPSSARPDPGNATPPDAGPATGADKPPPPRAPRAKRLSADPSRRKPPGDAP